MNCAINLHKLKQIINEVFISVQNEIAFAIIEDRRHNKNATKECYSKKSLQRTEFRQILLKTNQHNNGLKRQLPVISTLTNFITIKMYLSWRYLTKTRNGLYL